MKTLQRLLIFAVGVVATAIVWVAVERRFNRYLDTTPNPRD